MHLRHAEYPVRSGSFAPLTLHSLHPFQAAREKNDRESVVFCGSRTWWPETQEEYKAAQKLQWHNCRLGFYLHRNSRGYERADVVYTIQILNTDAVRWKDINHMSQRAQQDTAIQEKFVETGLHS